MNDAIRRGKDRGAELLAKGKLKPALEQFELVVKSAPREVGARQKVAEILVKLGRGQEALPHYEAVCDAYSHAGQFFKAIAICKVMLALAPTHSAAQDNLAKLYGATRQPTTKRAPVAEPISAAAFKAEPAPMTIEVVSASDELVADEEIIAIELVDEAAEVAPPPAGTASQLPKIPLFSDLTELEFKALLSGAVDARVFASGETIVSEGELAQSMFAICQGTVSVQRRSATGSREVARMTDGDIFGEMGLVLGGPRLASVVADGEVIALEFQRRAVDAVLSDHPGIGKALDVFYRERLLANVLRASPMFEPLSAETKQQLANAFEPRTVAKNDVLVTQGTRSDGVYLLLRGVCEVADVSGERYPDLAEGALFGEISIMLDKPATATVRAGSPVTVLRLPEAVFKQKVLSHPTVKALLVKDARERLERTSELLIRGLNTNWV